MAGRVLAFLSLGILLVGQFIGKYVTDSKSATTLANYTAAVTFVVAVWLLFVAQYEVWKREREARQLAEEKLKPAVSIGDIVTRKWPHSSQPMGVEYYFGVTNIGGVTLENVEVRLIGMEPRFIEYLPAHLHQKHDNEKPHATHFVLNPGDTKEIDLITGALPIIDGQPRPPRQPMCIVHTVLEVRTAIPFASYKLWVSVTAKDTPRIRAIFLVWIDEADALRCERLPDGLG